MTPLDYDVSKSLVALLKKRFPNLSTEETLTLVFEILSAIAVAEAKHE